MKQLEAKLLRVDEQWARRIESLKAQQEAIKDGYEETISGLQQCRDVVVKTPTKPLITTTDDRYRRDNEVLKARVGELEQRVESVKEYYLLKLRKNVEPPSIAVSG